MAPAPAPGACGGAGALRELQRLYYGPPDDGAPPGAPPGLLAIGRSRCIPEAVLPPPPESTVVVVGDLGSGKSSFVNAFAQELVLPRPSAPGSPPPPLQWVRSAASDPGAVPPLLAAAAAEHPKAFGDLSLCLGGAAATSRLDAVDLVEVRSQALVDDSVCEAVAWVAARAGVVLCLAHPKRQPHISPEVIGCLRRVMALQQQLLQQQPEQKPAYQQVQFALSKVDLVPRESDRINLTGKVRGLLSESFQGRSFQVLPIGRKDATRVLLEALKAAPTEVSVGGRTFQVPPAVPSGDEKEEALDAGFARVLQAAEVCAAERLAAGLAQLGADAEAARGAAAGALAESERAAAQASARAVLRPRLMQTSGALALTAAAAPLVLDEDVGDDLVWAIRAVCLTIAALLLSVLLLLPRAPAVAPAPEREALAATLREEICFCESALSQWRSWTGAAAA